MAVKIMTVAEAVEDNGIKALVHAPAGTGKTVLAATSKTPTLIISAESGLLSLKQSETELIRKGSPTFDTKLCRVVEIKTLTELEEVYELLLSQVADPDYDWIALDSITEIAEKVLNAELKSATDPRKAYGVLIQKMVDLLKDFRDLKNYNVLMTCKQQRITDGESGITSYVPAMPGSKLFQQIPYLFDEVWCLRIGVDEEENTFHYIQAVRDLQYEAKDRSGKLSACEPPSLKLLAEKIHSDVVESIDVGLDSEEISDEELKEIHNGEAENAASGVESEEKIEDPAPTKTFGFKKKGMTRVGESNSDDD